MTTTDLAPTDLTDWIYVKEAAAIFGVNHHTMTQLLAEAEVPVQQLVRRRRVRRADVEALLSKHVAPLLRGE